jgi:2-polyprenyl-3-methyl-5-hydroxy-6-metoxy-1,4-benzoquinol methylase
LASGKGCSLLPQLTDIVPLDFGPSSERRAYDSLGLGASGIYKLVESILSRHRIGGEAILDLGCGVGKLWPIVRKRFKRYIGVDIIRWDELPHEAEFVRVNFEKAPFPFADQCADAVVALEIIEHLENPRAFVRELTRLTKPDGWVLVSTPNQLSLLSKVTLLWKNQFNAFQEAPGLYPGHLSALLEVDLRRIAKENGLHNVEIHYSGVGRIPFTPWKWPRWFSGRGFSDNVLMLARRADGQLPVR